MRCFLLILVPIFLAVSLRTPARALDEPRVRTKTPGRAASGTLLKVATQLNPGNEEVLSWSVSVFLDGLTAIESSTAETDFEQLKTDGFAETMLAAGGGSFATIGVLSFTEPVALPAGESSVLRTVCLVTLKEPGEARILPGDGFELPGDQPPLRNEVLVAGGTTVPLSTQDAIIEVEGCAAFTLAALVEEGPDGPGTAELPEGGLLPLEVRVAVASEAHLHPTGFTLSIAHDDPALELSDIDFISAFTDTFVAGDGFALVEKQGERFQASFLSSETQPIALPAGDHAALRAVYTVRRGLPPDSTHSVRFEFSSPEGESGSPSNVFEPGEAMPCSLDGLQLELKVLTTPWIRGDGNSDGHVDISDAIVMLQHLFLGGPAPCERTMEINDDGKINMADPIALLNHLFFGAEPPPAPFPSCGLEPSLLPCETSGCR